MLAFARSLGEFGATITFAGSLQGRTRTLPLEIYLQRETDPDAAVALALVLLVVAVVVIGFARQGRRRAVRRYGPRQRGGAERDVEAASRSATARRSPCSAPTARASRRCCGVLAGLVRPDVGRVVLDGEVLTDVGPGRPGRMVAPHARRTALLGQDALLFPHLDALENVAFGPRSRGTSRGTARADAQRWLDEVGVGDLAHRRPRQLSGGQAQRVAVARALAADPRVLLLDEPMAALDVAVQPALRQVLRRVLTGRTAIVVTHDPLDALLLADRVVVLESGRVVEEGPSKDVLARPRSAFAGRLAGLNLVRGTWHDDAVPVRTPRGARAGRGRRAR